MKCEGEKILVVAQEITFAKALSSNDKFLRERALRRLKKWLRAKSHGTETFTEEGFMRLWKGLFYCVWMSDKPLPQEDVAEEISNLVHCFSNFEDYRKFVRCFFQAMSQAWHGIDQHRLDKFMMLIRRFLRQCFGAISKKGWQHKQVVSFGDDFYKSISMAPIGMNLHIIEVYLEELAKVGQGTLEPDIVLALITPFAKFMGELTDTRVLSHISKYIFLYLIRQSDKGIQEQTRFNAWRQLGFPGGDIEVMEEVEAPDTDNSGDEMDEDDRKVALDARAGNVDVLLPSIPFSPSAIVQLLTQIRTKKETTTKARRTIASLIDKLCKMEHGEYPLGVKKVEIPEDDDSDMVEEATEQLMDEWEKSAAYEKLENKRENKKSVGWEISSIKNEKSVNQENKNAFLHGTWKVTNMKALQSGLKRKSETSKDKSVKKFIVSSLESTEDVTKNKTDVNSIKENKKRKKRKQSKENGAGMEGAQDVSLNPNPKSQTLEENSWGKSEWETPLSEGEVELFIPNKTHAQKRLSLGQTKLQSWIKEGPQKKTTPVPTKKTPARTPGSAKKVAFLLNRNMAQEETEYKNSLKRRPSIPFDADKKPGQGVLKSTPVNSPINPFYRRKLSIS